MPVREAELKATFKTLRGLMERYRPPLVAKIDRPGQYELWSVKNIVVEGRPRSEVFFASAVVRKGYVGFYYMPIYASPEMRAFFPPELLALLKGKSCFHLGALDAKLAAHIRRALEAGLRAYRKRGWI